MEFFLITENVLFRFVLFYVNVYLLLILHTFTLHYVLVHIKYVHIYIHTYFVLSIIMFAYYNELVLVHFSGSL